MIGRISNGIISPTIEVQGTNINKSSHINLFSPEVHKVTSMAKNQFMIANPKIADFELSPSPFS